MKTAIASLCLVGFGLAGGLNIGLGARTAGQLNAYDLNCNGANGSVKYYVTGLPQGVTFDGNTIVVTNSAVAGTYTINIKAVDQSGQSAERNVNLSIQTQAINQYSGQYTNNFQNQFNTGLNIAYQGVNGLNLGSVTVNQGSVNIGGNQSNGANGQTGGSPNSGSPNGGSPNGGSPSGGSPSGGSPSSNAQLNALLSTYSSGTTTTTQTYPGNRYPEPNLPTAPDNSLVNNTPNLIATTQTKPTEANRNQITSDDVKLRAASDRHQNAIKGITNLLQIIDKANANKNRAQSDIQTYTQAYNDAVSAQRASQNDIIAAQTRSAQIISAINALSSTIEDLKNKINQAVAQRDALNKQKTTIMTTITDLETQKSTLMNQLDGINKQVSDLVKQLSNKNSDCQSINDSINKKTADLTNAQNQYANIDANRNIVVADINNKSSVVDDLRSRLQKAEKDLADSKIKLADLDAKKLSLPLLISGLQNDLALLKAQAAACAAQLARIQGLIDSLKTGNYKQLADKIGSLGDQVNSFRSQVTNIDAQIAASQGPLQDLKAKLGKAQDDLSFIRNQKIQTDAALRTAYQRGNDTNNRVAFAKQNLDAIVKRFQDESKIVSDATLNLERARAEQALARQGLQQLIAHYSNALPYAIVPNGNGLTNPGTPFGNNPSGSPLGPINTNGDGAPGSFRVSNWVNYLSSAYGAGVSPAFTGSVTQLFPFNFLSITGGNQASNTGVLNAYGNIRGQTGGVGGLGVFGALGGGCSARSGGLGQRVTTGVVVAVRSDSFDVQTQQNQKYTINVAPCTKLNANVANYKVQTGHKAIIKGFENSAQKIDGSLITCIA